MTELTINPPLVRLQNTRWHAYAAILIGVFATSFAPVWIRYAQAEGVPTLVIVAIRMSLSPLLLTPIVLARYSREIRQFSRRDILLGALAGFWLFVSFFSFLAAIEHISLMLNEVLGNSSALWVALMEILFLKATLKRSVWFGLVLALVGCTVIGLSSSGEVGMGHNPLLGGALSLAGAITYAIYLVTGRSLRARISFVPYIWLVFGFTGLFSLMTLGITRTPITGYTPNGYWYILLMVLIPQLVGHSLVNYSLRYLSATFISVTGLMTVITSGLYGWLLFQEIPAIIHIPASLAILAGVVLVSRGQSAHEETFVHAETPVID